MLRQLSACTKADARRLPVGLEKIYAGIIVVRYIPDAEDYPYCIYVSDTYLYRYLVRYCTDTF